MAGGEGSTFGKYFLLKRLAIGGMGEIFLAKLKGPVGFEKLLVLKCILQQHTENQDFVDMFFAEARVAAQLNHSNIVQIYEMGEIEDAFYIGMEYCHGKSLRDLIDRARDIGKPIAPAHVIEIISELCDGLGYAHDAQGISGESIGIIHRDVNPQNLLISYTGEVKIIDFGIAKSDMSMHKTETGTIKGKFVYMSPEQSAAEKLDKRSDIFSVGICLYEALTFHNPFAKANVVLSLDAIQRHDPPLIGTDRPDLEAFQPIVEKALAKKCSERYATCSELRSDLQKLLDSDDIAKPELPLAEYMANLFEEEMAQEQRTILETDSASTMQLERMRVSAKKEHQSDELALADTQGFFQDTAEQHVAAQQDAAPGPSPAINLGSARTKTPFYVVLALIVVTTIAGAFIIRPGESPRAPETKEPARVVQLTPEPGTAPARPTQPSSGEPTAIPTPPEDTQAQPTDTEGQKDSRSTASTTPTTARPAHRTTKASRVNRPPQTRRSESPSSSTRSPQPSSRTTGRPSPSVAAPPLPPPPSPVAGAASSAFGSMQVSTSPPVTIVRGGKSIGQTFRLTSSVGTLTFGSGSDRIRDPFVIRIRYRVQENRISYAIESSPWAIVRGKDGIGLGRTPLRATDLGSSAVLEFLNPKQQLQQRITLRFLAP